jgi:hypothetical protein
MGWLYHFRSGKASISRPLIAEFRDDCSIGSKAIWHLLFSISVLLFTRLLWSPQSLTDTNKKRRRAKEPIHEQIEIKTLSQSDG